MIFTEETNSRRLNIIVQDDFDWLELFDNRNLENEIPITLNWKNMDFFFPNWRTEADPANLAETLNELRANRFGSIQVTIADEVINKHGEGVYEVQAFAITFPAYYGDEKFLIAGEDIILAKIFYKVAPQLPNIHQDATH